jgi:hypothetical protein
VPTTTGTEVLLKSAGVDALGEAGTYPTGLGRCALEAICGVEAVSVGPLAMDERMLEKESANYAVSLAVDIGPTISGRRACWVVMGAATTGPTSSGKCTLEPEVVAANPTSSGGHALEPRAAAIEGEPSPEEPVPAKT